mgnify:CR=1 FL=1
MEPYPVIAVTSRLLTTGVDVRACKLIVIDRTVKSLTEFKQMVGRGTRIDEEYGKLYFTIIDFRRATNLFADPDFDGDPKVIYEPDNDEDIVEPEGSAQPDPDTTDHTELGGEEGRDLANGDNQTPRLPPVSHLGSVKELVKPFGRTRDGFLQAIRELETELYRNDKEGRMA